ncbi:hypothetical protein GP486_004604 [Trichoglossum hirsutum]|uniref:Uncharacterized protein n=1 Tax=Trichoglossum hirsutum TaxID=265104 RepID=A0A9P8RNU5_9PEZI|nr:hypothetical protein GP486_004604 [Trichoglossum hirsutum]
MNVLPGKASLASFFGVLALVLLLTVLLAFNMRKILSAIPRGQRRATDFIRTSVRDPIGEKWKSLMRSLHGGDTLSGSEETQATTRRRDRDKRSFLVSLLYFLVVELPQREIAYSLRLFRRPKVPFYIKTEFGIGKFIGDLMRLLLLPLWMVLAILVCFAWAVRAFTRQLSRLVTW